MARFLASTFNGAAFPFDLFELRTLACIDALRWGKADLHRLLPDGEQRVSAVLFAWGTVKDV